MRPHWTSGEKRITANALGVSSALPASLMALQFITPENGLEESENPLSSMS